MRLSKQPAQDLKIEVTVERTPLWDKDRPDCNNADHNHDNDNAKQHIDDDKLCREWKKQLQLIFPEPDNDKFYVTFKSENWWKPHPVVYKAIKDGIPEQYLVNNQEDGSKVQSFPQIAPRASRLAGPVTVNGYEDGSVDTSIPDPLMLTHETEDGLFLSNLEVLRQLKDVYEDKQVDTMVLTVRSPGCCHAASCNMCCAYVLLRFWHRVNCAFKGVLQVETFCAKCGNLRPCMT